MRRHLLSLFFLSALLIHSLGVLGQTNLVSNPGFETYTTCPWTLSQLAFATGWGQPTLHFGSPDYFNSCATGFTSVPTNTFGTTNAHGGNAYSGFYLGLASGAYREHPVGTLTSPLVAGATYLVKVWIARSTNSKYACSSFGVYFSNSYPSAAASTSGAMGVTPQAQYSGTAMLSTNNAWVLIQDTIVAAGGEQYLTIGNFQVSPTVALVNNSATISGAYYYADDVSVTLLQDIYGDTLVCQGDTATLVSTLDTTISWVDSAAPTVVLGTNDTFQVAPSQTTTYWAIVPGDTHSWTVTVPVLPTGFLGNDTVICDGSTIIKAVNFPNTTYLWSDGGTDSILITNQSGNHWLEIEQFGCTESDTFNVTFYNFPEVDLGDDTSICHYDSLTLNTGITGPYQMMWSDGSFGQSLLTVDSGSYWVQVSNINCSYSDTILIEYNPELEVELGNPQEHCYIDTIFLTPVTANVTGFQWSTGSTQSTLEVLSTGVYTVTVTDGDCYTQDEVLVEMFFYPIVDLGNDTSLCFGDEFALDPGMSPNLNFVWNTGANTGSEVIQESGLYWLQASDEHCTDRDSVLITDYPLLEIDLGEDLQSCVGDMVTLSMSSSEPLTGYQWSDGSANSTLQVTESGKYSVTATNGFCFAEDELRIYFFDYPDFDFGNDTSVCLGTSLEFDISAPWPLTDYKWFNGATMPSQSFTFTSAKKIWAQADNFGCKSSDTIRIGIHTPPQISLGNDTAICPDDGIVLNASIGDTAASYAWSNGLTSPSITATNSGGYTVTINDGKCSSSDSIHIAHRRIPTIELEAPDYICLGEAFELDAFDSLFYDYRWQDGSNYSTFLVTEDGSYSVTATHICGTVTDSVSTLRCECTVHVPNAFSPNTDGLNERFRPESDCRFSKYTFAVYSRWGEVMFQSSDPDAEWDGTYAGVKVPSGIYAWSLEYHGDENGKVVRKVLSGTVTLLR